jgi:protein O-mannosyl-transferase
MQLLNRPWSPEPDNTVAGLPRALAPKDWFFVVVFLAAVILVYQPVWRGGFIFDDDVHLLNNPVLQPGGLLKTWVPGTYLYYWPLTSTAFRLEFDIWGLNPVGFHIVNIALHAISALLVWRVLLHLKIPGAMFAAALFAIHPVNVESVAWISQLKNILSLLFGLLSVLLYLRSEAREKRCYMVLSVGAFLLSTLAKGMLLTLPVVLLACAWWQRGRIGRKDLLRVLPFVLIGAIMVGVEIWGQRLAGAEESVVRSDSLMSRAAVAGCAVWFYLWKVIWPIKLSFVYPRWSIDERNVLSYLPGVLLVIILALGWWMRRSWGRHVVMLMVCYVGLLLPALGFVNIAYMEMSLVADHWQYAAMIVPCAIFAAVMATLGRPLWRRPAGYALCLALLAVLGGLTWQQSRRYADEEMLYRTTIAENPDCWVAYNNLGCALVDRNQVNEAIAQYRKALELKPDFFEPHLNLGNVLVVRGHVDEAIAQYKKALEIKPNHANAHNNLGLALANCGQVDEAIAHYQKALNIKPGFAEVHNNLGLVLAGRGDVDEAITHYQKALKIKPDDAQVHNNLGIVLASCGRFDEAIAHYQNALEIKPDYAQAHNNLGVVLAGRGEIDEAIAHYQKALEIKPDYADAHYDLGLALARRGHLDEAVSHYQKVLEINPGRAETHSSLGLALAQCGRFDEAIVQFQKALEINSGYANARDNLRVADSQREAIRQNLAQQRELLSSRPDDIALLNDTAWILATNPNPSIRNGMEAVELAGRARDLSSGQEPAVLGTLAAAYAEVGRFAEAVKTAHTAVELATQQKNQELAESIKAKISLYEAGAPFRATPQFAPAGKTKGGIRSL